MDRTGSGEDRLALFAHALSQPLTLLGLAIASLERYEETLRRENAKDYAQDLGKLRRIYARLTQVVSEMRPTDGEVPPKP